MNTTARTNAPEWTHPLFLHAQNDRAISDSLTTMAANLRGLVDRAARGAATARADWHDDPDGDPAGHAAAHAPAAVQFPPSVRAAVALELLEYYLTGSQGIEAMEDPAPVSRPPIDPAPPELAGPPWPIANLVAVLDLIEARKHRAKGYTTDPDRVRVRPGRKYDKIDVGASGAWMVEKATGAVYGIKGYGVPHKGKHHGNLADIDPEALHASRFVTLR